MDARHHLPEKQGMRHTYATHASRQSASTDDIYYILSVVYTYVGTYGADDVFQVSGTTP